MSFALILVALATVGLIGRFRTAPIVSGVPEHPAVAAAIARLSGQPPVLTGELRFASSLDPSGDAARRRPAGVDPEGLEEAKGMLLDARAALRSDPRVDCILGHLELARHRFDAAERHYQAALRGGVHYGEARLGLALALALSAALTPDERRARGLRLRSIAHLAAVEERDPFHLPALYDRAILLARVGRPREAHACAERYRSLDPGPWSDALSRLLESLAAQ